MTTCSGFHTHSRYKNRPKCCDAFRSSNNKVGTISRQLLNPPRARTIADSGESVHRWNCRGRLRQALGGEFRHDPFGQGLTQFHSPLIEAVDVPDAALGEHLVFVQGDKLPEHKRAQPWGQDRIGGSVAVHGAMRDQLFRAAFGAQFIGVLTEGQGLALSEKVGHEQVLVAAERAGGAGEADEIAGHRFGALVQQLIKGMLTIGAGLAPDQRPGLAAGDPAAAPIGGLAVALHIELLQVIGKAAERLTVREYRVAFHGLEVVVPDPEQAQDHRPWR